MFILTESERIAIVAGCIGLVFIVIVLTICFVCGFCWFNKLITHRKRKEDAGLNYFWNHFPERYLYQDPPTPYEPSTKSTFFNKQRQLNFNRCLTPMNSISTICSDTDSVTGIPLPIMEKRSRIRGDHLDNFLYKEARSINQADAVLLPKENLECPGRMSITLQFKRIKREDNKVFSQLRVYLKEAVDLPIREYGGKCDPYCIISLYDKKLSKKEKRKSSIVPLHTFHTTTVKNTQHPAYNESFFFPLEPSQLKKGVIKFEAWDKDKLANDTALGEVYFSLKEVTPFLLQEPAKELELNLKLQQSKLVNGQLLLGLCYLPTSERMTVAVLKASNLKATSENNNSDYYVKAMAIYGGKVFDRRKTSSRPSSSFPVFNEMLMFDVPLLKLEHIVLLVTICNTSKHASVENSHKKTTKNACIGKVIISSCSGKNSLNHWNAMRNSPRRQIIQWHELC